MNIKFVFVTLLICTAIAVQSGVQSSLPQPPIIQPTQPDLQPIQPDITIDDEGLAVEVPLGQDCFSADVYIFQKEEGFIQMKDLKIGALIRTKEGKFTKVTSFLHYQPNQFMECVKITNGISQFYASPLHCISDQKEVYVFAKDLLNKTVYGSFGKILNISKQLKEGVYAPFTQAGDYFVYTSDRKSHILAHSLGHTRNPKLAYEIVNGIIQIYELAYGTPITGEHPVGTWLRQKLGFLAE